MRRASPPQARLWALGRAAPASVWRGPDLNRRHHGFQPCALPTELPRRVAAGSIALHKKRRPDRCYRVANVSVIGRLRPTGQKCNAWTRPEVRYVQEAAPLELAPDTFEGHPDRRLRSPAVGDRDVASGRGDARELVEERDHVVERDQIERAGIEGERGRVADVVALAPEPPRFRDHPGRDVD